MTVLYLSQSSRCISQHLSFYQHDDKINSTSPIPGLVWKRRCDPGQDLYTDLEGIGLTHIYYLLSFALVYSKSFLVYISIKCSHATCPVDFLMSLGKKLLDSKQTAIFQKASKQSQINK